MTTSSPEKIRVTDLRRPVLTTAQQQGWAYAAANLPPLSVEAVLDTASAQSGLDDFGPRDFEARLGLQLAEIDEDPARSPVARATTFANSVRHATTRLRVLDLLRQHPEIRDVPINQPVFVVGLPRSGTTHLVNLLAADQRFRSLPLWESQSPVPGPKDVIGADGIDPRFTRSQRRWQQMSAASPLLAAMHPMNPEHIHEELELMLPDFTSYNFEWANSMAPRWRDHHLGTDQRPAYAFLRTMLQVVQWLRGQSEAGDTAERWILKCPQHLEQLGPLMETFPDAHVVMTHRDPVSVVQSAATMAGYGARMHFEHPDIDAIFDYWADRVDRLLTAGMRDLPGIEAGLLTHVPFDGFMADELGTVERILDDAGIDFTDTARRQVGAHRAGHQRGSGGQIVYDLRADFGREPDEVRARYAAYVSAHSIAPEVH